MGESESFYILNPLNSTGVTDIDYFGAQRAKIKENKNKTKEVLT